MTADRDVLAQIDQLAELIRKAGQDARDADAEAGYRCGFDTDRFIADAILAAGWRAPHQHKFDRWVRTELVCQCGEVAPIELNPDEALHDR